jgi:hypothetical protein
MTIQLELDPDMEAGLKAQAALQGIALEQYALKVLEKAAASRLTGAGKLTREGLRAMTTRLQLGSEKRPVLPPEATERASFYEDRW